MFKYVCGSYTFLRQLDHGKMKIQRFQNRQCMMKLVWPVYFNALLMTFFYFLNCDDTWSDWLFLIVLVGFWIMCKVFELRNVQIFFSWWRNNWRSKQMWKATHWAGVKLNTRTVNFTSAWFSSISNKNKFNYFTLWQPWLKRWVLATHDLFIDLRFGTITWALFPFSNHTHTHTEFECRSQ